MLPIYLVVKYKYLVDWILAEQVLPQPNTAVKEVLMTANKP